MKNLINLVKYLGASIYKGFHLLPLFNDNFFSIGMSLNLDLK